jgi:subtilisin family serine protease
MLSLVFTAGWAAAAGELPRPSPVLPYDIRPIESADGLVHPNRLLIRTDDPQAVIANLGRGARLIKSFPQIGYASVWVPAERRAASLARLRQTLGAANAQSDHARRPAYTPNDPLFPQMWHATAMNLATAWDLGFGSNNITVAVMDTGVRTDHEDLAANMWVNPGEVAGNGLDDDSNGYVDDIYGWDFAYNDNVPNDVNGHGTACAGLVAGIMDNGKGAVGVASRARIMALKPANDSGYFYDTENIASYLYAERNGANIISCSFFSDRVSQAERIAIDFVSSRNVLVVVAAGNDYTVMPYYPGAYESVLAVAAYGTNNLKTSWSNYGSWVDVSAPGTGLRTTSSNGQYTTGFGGTSGACPQVAGLAALVWSMNPGMTATQVRRIVEDSATPQNQAPFGEYAAYGRADARKAMEVVLGISAPVSRPPVVRWVSPLGTRVRNVMVYGRGLDGNTFNVSVGDFRVRPTVRNRSHMIVRNSNYPLLRVSSGATLATVPLDRFGLEFPLAEASSRTARLEGGFAETLTPQDGQQLRVFTTAANQTISMEGAFKLVLAEDGTAQLRLRRRGLAGITGTEKVELYDWSTGSFPYGSWVQISSGPVPTDWQSSVIDVPNYRRLIDPEGHVYVRISVSGTQVQAAELQVDELRLTK